MTRVLIVEDSPTQSASFRFILESAGFEVETAKDGEDGWEKLLASPFHLVVSDVVMPRLSGFDLCRRMKSDQRVKDVPIILLTTLNDPMDIVQALEAGADNFISKPCDPDDLVARIRGILETARLRPERSLSVNVEMVFGGRRFVVGSGKEQILSLLMSAFEDMVRTNRELRATQLELCAAQEKLEGRAQASEDMYASLMDQANDAIVVAREDGIVLQANRQAEALIGRSAEGIVGRSLAEFIAADQAPFLEEPRVRIQSRGFLHSEDVLFRRPDGTTVEVDASVSVVEARGQRLRLSIFRDITDRKRAQRLLDVKALVTRTLAQSGSFEDATPDLLGGVCGTLRWDVGELWLRERGLLRFARSWTVPSVPSRFASQSHGQTLASGVGLPGRVWAEAEALWLEDVAVESEVRFSRVPLAVEAGLHTAVAVPISFQGEVLGVLLLLSRDVRRLDVELLRILEGIGSQIGQFIRRTQSEEALRRQALILDHLNDAVFVTDLDGRITDWNRGAEATFGYSKKEMIGRRHELVIAPGSGANASEILESALTAGRWTGEVPLLRKDGNGGFIDLDVRALRDASGTAVATFGVARDITEKKLLEDQFRQAQKMEAIGRLAGGIAHDFNNILTAILGFSDLLLIKVQEPSWRAHLEEIRRAGERAAGLTRQLLLFSRKQVVKRQVLDLNAITRGMDEMLRRMIGESIDFKARLDRKLGRVEADAGQIEQVLMNLVVNAFDAMPSGGKLTVETKNVDLDDEYASEHVEVTPGRYAMLAVSDTGIGMDAATRSRIFEPFFTTKEPGKGTGLGLATTYGIVKQAGGHIGLYSEPGNGTTFKIYLPIVQKAPSSASSPIVGSVRRGTESILLVEDDVQLRRLVRLTLESSGYTVVEASDGDEALRILEKRRPAPALMISDSVMPGLRVIDLLAKVPVLAPSTRVILMSGYTDEAVIRHGILDTGVPFLQKPFTADGLLRLVRGVLDGA